MAQETVKQLVGDRGFGFSLAEGEAATGKVGIEQIMVFFWPYG